MKNKIIIAFLFISFLVWSEEIKIRVIEVKGSVVQRYMENDWVKVESDMEILSGTEFFTGFHSSISFEIGKGSYITINQLSNVVFDKITVEKNSNIVNLFLLSGYAVVYSKEKKDSISIICEENIINFSKSGGEVYLRKEKGILVTCDSGRIKITSKFKNFYFIGKNELCGIDIDGHIIENDYFLKRNSNTISNDNINENSIIAYFDLFFKPYTLDINKNDYFDNQNP